MGKGSVEIRMKQNLGLVHIALEI